LRPEYQKIRFPGDSEYYAFWNIRPHSIADIFLALKIDHSVVSFEVPSDKKVFKSETFFI
jgi:hypothetical protein